MVLGSLLTVIIAGEGIGYTHIMLVQSEGVTGLMHDMLTRWASLLRWRVFMIWQAASCKSRGAISQDSVEDRGI